MKQRSTTRVVRSCIALTGLIFLGGVVVEHALRPRVSRALRPPGRTVPVGGRQFHLHCTGDGHPTVILEAGIGGSGSQSWTAVQPEISSETRACSYDRAGVLWSEPGERPRDAETVAQELNAVLTSASISPPYVMVGHSFGGFFVRVFADRFPEDVVGMVLVDASHPDQDSRLSEALGKPQRGRSRSTLLQVHGPNTSASSRFSVRPGHVEQCSRSCDEHNESLPSGKHAGSNRRGRCESRNIRADPDQCRS